MTQVNPDERQKAKAAAANLAVAANDAAVTLGVVGVVGAAGLVATGVGALAGVGVGATFAVGSFAAWYVGNRYQRLANDPPRDDFDIVSISAATSGEAGQSPSDVEVATRLFAVHQILLADAIDCLVTSLERYDGAIESGASDHAQLQADAVRQNSLSVLSAQSVLFDCASMINQAWTMTEVDWSGIQVDDVKSLYLESAGPPHHGPGAELQSILDAITGLDSASTFTNLDSEEDPVLSLSELPMRPEVLIGAAFINAATELSSALEFLVNEDDS